MELTEKERMLIEAVREMDEPVYNVLLWYTAGVENARDKSLQIYDEDHIRIQSDNRKIDIARSYMRGM